MHVLVLLVNKERDLNLIVLCPASLLSKRFLRDSCNPFLCFVKSFIRLVYFPQSLQIVLINKLVGSYSYVTYVETLLTPSSDGKQIISKEDENQIYWSFV